MNYISSIIEYQKKQITIDGRNPYIYFAESEDHVYGVYKKARNGISLYLKLYKKNYLLIDI